MIARKLIFGKDFPEICEWWRTRGWPMVPSSALPVNGIVAECEQWKHAACWFYVIEGRWAWIDYVVANPHSPLREKPKAIELVVTTARDAIVALKQSAGLEPLIMTTLENENLIAIFEKCGFKMGDKKMSNLVWGG